MKKTIVLAAVAMLVAGTVQCADAQSTVTLYGIVDTGIAYTNSVAASLKGVGAYRWSMVSGSQSGSRWGMTAREDLGGGTSVVFQLENGFNSSNGTLGQGGRMFGRQAYVGLANDRFGTLTLGRQYQFEFDWVSPLMSWAQFGSVYGAHVGDVDNAFQTYRLNNSVKYQISPLSGLQLGALYAFSNQGSASNGAGFSNNRAYEFGINYVRGPLTVAASYLSVSNPSAGIAASTNPNGAIGDEYSNSTTIFYNTGFVDSQRVYALGGGYKVGAATLDLVFTNTLLEYRGGQSLRVANYEINGRYQFTPALTAGIGYIYTDGSGFAGGGSTAYATGTHPQWHQVDAGVTYLLSKRSDFHFSAVYQHAAGDATEAVQNLVGPAGAGRKSQLTLVLGFRHRF